jgi:uncharacterized protein YcfL
MRVLALAWVGVGLLLLTGCGGTDAPLVVKQFKVLDTSADLSADPMVSNEKQRRLHGAITAAEKRERLGAYYTLLWHDPAGPGEVEVRFEYQQAASASKVLRRSQWFAAGESSGVAEFAITGTDYLRNGRVTAWQASLLRGGRVIATERSYLWRKRPAF